MTTKKKLLIYKILIFVFGFIVAFMPSTASRSREVNSRVIVEILGIDGGDKISVTAQYVMPTATQGATSKDTVTVDGDTLEEAVESLSTALGRRAELGHCSMIIMGSSASPELVGTLMTATDITADVYLAAAEDKAKDIVGEITDFMKKSGTTDADFIAYSAHKSHVATNTLLGFMCDLGSAAHCSFMPVVKMIEEEESGGGQSGGSESSSSGQTGGSQGGSGQNGGASGGEQKSKGGTGMNVERLALYDNDGRIGMLEKDAARGVAWVSSPVEKGIVTADVEVDGETVKNVSARLLKKCVCIKTDAKTNSANIKVKAVIEPRGDKFNILAAKNSKSVELAIKQGFAEAIEKELAAAFEDALKLNCDPLFVSKEFYRYSPDYFETEFDLNNVVVSYNVEINIK